MGNKVTKTEDSDEIILNNTYDDKILHEESVEILYSPEYDKKYSKCILYFCENELKVITEKNKYIILYQKIVSWIHTGKYWGFKYIKNNKELNFRFKVVNGYILSHKINEIVKDLQNYYKEL